MNMMDKESVDKNDLSETDKLRKGKMNKKDGTVTIIPKKNQDPSVDRQNPMGEKIG